MYYIQIPSHVYLNKDLSATAQKLYGLIIALSSKDGYCYASNKALAEMLELSPRTIGYCLKDLLDEQLIHIEINDRNNFRKILTIDTAQGAKRFKTQKEAELAPISKGAVRVSSKKVAPVPDWMQEFKDLIRDGQ